MRQAALALLVMLAGATAHAEDAPDAPAAKTEKAKPEKADKPAKAAPAEADPGADADDVDTPSACTAPKDMKTELQLPFVSACKFFTALAARDPLRVYRQIHAPFYFEAKSAPTLEDAGRKWAALIADLGHNPSTLYSVEVLSYDDMVKKYGKPPAKLDSVPLRGAVMAVANLDGHAEVAALKRDGGSWLVFAFND